MASVDGAEVCDWMWGWSRPWRALPIAVSNCNNAKKEKKKIRKELDVGIYSAKKKVTTKTVEEIRHKAEGDTAPSNWLVVRICIDSSS